MVKFINFLRGYLRIRVKGDCVERFMNLCGNKNLLIWDVQGKGDCYEMYISLPAFYELRPIVRKTSTRAVILKRYGLPFLLPTLRKRTAFSVCCVAVVAFWYISSFFLWDIEFEGNLRLTDEVIMDFMESQSVHIGMMKKNADIELLEKELRKAFTEITWASLKLEGTKLLVSVRENDAPIIESWELESDVSEQTSGMDIFTEYDGQIVSIIVRSGVPKVAVGDSVTADTVLVEGKVPVLGEDGLVREYLYVDADADITVQHVIPYQDDIPMCYQEKYYTGRTKKGFFLRWDREELSIKDQSPFLMYDTVAKTYRPEVLEKLGIPLYFGTIENREYYYLELKYDSEQVSELLGEKLIQFIAGLEQKGVQIIEKNVKISSDSENWISVGEMTIVEPIVTKRVTVTENISTVENE